MDARSRSSSRAKVTFRALVVVLVLSTFAFPARSDVQFERLSIRDGLPATFVIGLTQDRQGFLWIADLNDGLIRYDGYAFKSYRHDPHDPTSISSNEVRFVTVDPSGTLWIGTGAGLNRYDQQTDAFTRITTKSDRPAGLSHDGIAFVMFDSSGRMWIGTEKGLNRLDPGAEKFRQYHVERGYIRGAPAPDWFWTAFEDSTGELWFGSAHGGGLLRYDSSTDTLEQFLYEVTPESPPVTSVRSIIQDRSGLIWLASERGLATLDPATRRFERIHFRSPIESVNKLGLPEIDLQFWFMREDASGHIWITTRSSGVFRISPDRSSWRHYQHDPDDPYSISGNDVWYSYSDRSGQLWFATANDGLSRYNPWADTVDYIAMPAELAKSGALSLVRALPDDRIIVGTAHQGLWVVDPASHRWNQLPWPSTGYAKDTRETWVGPEGTLWVSSRSNFFQLDAKLAKTKSFEHLKGTQAMHFGSDGSLWLASSNYQGIAHFDPATGDSASWKVDATKPDALGHMFVAAMFEDSRGNFWVGTYRGLDLMDRQTGRFKHYDPDPTRPNALPAGNVVLIVEDDNGDLWIKHGAGVSRFKHDNNEFESFQFAESPIDARESGDQQISLMNDRLWWGSATGLTSFDLRTGEYQRLGPAQGIVASPKDTAALSDGTLVLAYNDRLGLFSPSRILADPTHPGLAITNIRIGNRELEHPSTPQAAQTYGYSWTPNGLSLPHDHATLTIEFAGLHFSSPLRNRYAYQLKGLDSQWLETDARNRRATYTTLPPGRYTFLVKAGNPNGVWNDKGLSLELTVLPPWWKTWWAYVLYSVTAILGVFLAIWLRTRSLHERAATLERQVADRTRELSEQQSIVQSQAEHLERLIETKDRLMTRISHEFRTPLTVILGPIEGLVARTDGSQIRTYLGTVRRNASRLLRLIDQLLGLARLRSGHAEPTRAVAAAPIIRQVVASFESLAVDRGLDLAIDELEELTLQSTGDAIEKIVVNLVSNAIKYSESGGRIRLSLVADAGKTGTLRVTDTGRGISPERLPHIFEPFERGHDEAERIPGSGLGLALVQELATSHGGTVHAESTAGVGSMFLVTLPLSSSTAKDTAAIGASASEEARIEVNALRGASDPIPINVETSALGASLLLIEDNADMRTYLAEVLGGTYQLKFAGDGNSGLEMAMADVPDLIVCDIMLPGKNGYEICHALKTDDRTSHIPVILLTALEGRDNRLKGLMERADDYLTKPFDEAELRQRIANLLDLRAVLQRRFARDLRFDEVPPADLSQRDQSFLQKLARVTASHHSDPKFDLARLASAMAVGERHLQRKLHALVGLTPGEYLRAYRLQRAIERLRAGERPGDVAFAVGFSSQAYFSTCFRAQFGFRPSETRERMKQH